MLKMDSDVYDSFIGLNHEHQDHCIFSSVFLYKLMWISLNDSSYLHVSVDAMRQSPEQSISVSEERKCSILIINIVDGFL
jgi:hypothetical protein